MASSKCRELCALFWSFSVIFCYLCPRLCALQVYVISAHCLFMSSPCPLLSGPYPLLSGPYPLLSGPCPLLSGACLLYILTSSGSCLMMAGGDIVFVTPHRFTANLSEKERKKSVNTGLVWFGLLNLHHT